MAGQVEHLSYDERLRDLGMEKPLKKLYCNL